MDIVEELNKTRAMLLLVPSTDYNSLSTDIAKQLSGKTVIYVTLNKTFLAIKESFANASIDTKNFVFIDAISKSIRNVADQGKGCYFVSAPTALTEIVIKITKALEHGFEYLIFDSLSTLLVYQKDAPVAKFAANIVSNAKAKKTKTVFYALKSEEQKAAINEVSMFVDRVIDLGE